MAVKQTSTILLTELTPEHELPVADEDIVQGQPVRWNRSNPELVWPASVIGNAFGVALNTAAKGEFVKIAPLQVGTATSPTTMQIDFKKFGIPDMTRVIVLRPVEVKARILIRQQDYDPSKHNLPRAGVHIHTGLWVSFTDFGKVVPHEPGQNDLHGIALNDAEPFEEVKVLVNGNIASPDALIAVYPKEESNDAPQT